MASVGSEQPTGGTASGLLDSDYTIEFGVKLGPAGGGQLAYGARSARTGSGLMAVQVQLGWPVRARALSVLAGNPIVFMLSPLAYGAAPLPSGEMGYFVICPAAPGASLAIELRPWSERELLELLLRPAALGLADLHGRGVTHRSIRLDNLFRANATDSVTLGCAWAAPPACRQPCVYEPPYSALCMPAGRGDGVPADDIYALGVIMATLALGRVPMEGLDAEQIIRRKVDEGSFEALIGRNRLPTAIAELVRGMLADDPEHRPSAVLLGDPAAARARRAAARPQRRGQRLFPLGQPHASTTRELALAIMGRPDIAAPHLRDGSVSMWLRRNIGDGAMASRIEDVCRLRDDALKVNDPSADLLLATRAIAILDPLAPLSWRRLTLWPDGLGAALNHALCHDPSHAGAVADIAVNGITAIFAQQRPERTDAAAQDAALRLVRSAVTGRPADQVLLRLNYALNPLTPCDSPLVAGRWVAKLGDLLPALELAAASPLKATLPPVDRHIAAFIDMRREERMTDLGRLAGLVMPSDPLTHLRLLARLQQYTQPEKLPGLTSWMAELVNPATARFHAHSRRVKLAERLAELAQGGMLPGLVALLDDQQKLTSDQSEYQAAIARGAAIDAELEAIAATKPQRHAASGRAAHDVTNGLGLGACGLALAAAAFL